MSQGQGLGHVYPHQEGPRQPRALGYGYAFQVTPGYPRLFQGQGDHGDDLQNVLPGGHLGHHPAVPGVDLYLRGDYVGVDEHPVLHHRRRGLIA